MGGTAVSAEYGGSCRRRWRERVAEILMQIIVLLVICSVVALFEIVLRGN